MLEFYLNMLTRPVQPVIDFNRKPYSDWCSNIASSGHELSTICIFSVLLNGIPGIYSIIMLLVLDSYTSSSGRAISKMSPLNVLLHTHCGKNRFVICGRQLSAATETVSCARISRKNMTLTVLTRIVFVSNYVNWCRVYLNYLNYLNYRNCLIYLYFVIYNTILIFALCDKAYIDTLYCAGVSISSYYSKLKHDTYVLFIKWVDLMN